MEKKTLYLICNAHLDPVWLWNMEEGISAALSTFHTAADFCENYDGFVFTTRLCSISGLRSTICRCLSGFRNW